MNECLILADFAAFHITIFTAIIILTTGIILFNSIPTIIRIINITIALITGKC